MAQVRTLVLAAAVLLLGTTPADTQPRRAQAAVRIHPTDVSAINGLFRRWERAWNAQDARAWAQLFHQDGTWILWTGREWKGRAAIEAGITEPFRTVYRGSRQVARTHEIRPIAPGVVVARLLSKTTGDSRQPGVTIYGNKMLILTKRNGSWGILYGQNTRLTPEEIKALKLD